MRMTFNDIPLRGSSGDPDMARQNNSITRRAVVSTTFSLCAVMNLHGMLGLQETGPWEVILLSVQRKTWIWVSNIFSGGIEVALKSGTAKHYSQLSFSGFTGCEIAFLCQDASVLLCLQPLGELHGLQGSE